MGLIARIKRLWKITNPLIEKDNDLDYVTGLEMHIQKFETVIDTYNEQVEELISKTDPDNMYKMFIDNFEMSKNRKKYIVDECIRVVATTTDAKPSYASMRIGRITIKDLEIDFSSDMFTLVYYNRRIKSRIEVYESEVDSKKFNKLRKMVGIRSMYNTRSEAEIIEALSKL